MAGDWITGEEVEQNFNVIPLEIGKACFDGRITAYLLKGWGPIYERSKLPRVPKYPPTGIDRKNYTQSGESVKWDWDTQLTHIARLKRRYVALYSLLEKVALAIETRSAQLSPLAKIPLPGGVVITIQNFDAEEDLNENLFKERTIEDLKRIHSLISIKIESAKDQAKRERVRLIGDTTYLSAERHCLLERNAFRGQIAEMDIYQYAWDKLMAEAYLWFIDGKTYADNQLEGRLFTFGFESFIAVYAKKNRVMPS